MKSVKEKVLEKNREGRTEKGGDWEMLAKKEKGKEQKQTLQSGCVP